MKSYKIICLIKGWEYYKIWKYIKYYIGNEKKIEKHNRRL